MALLPPKLEKVRQTVKAAVPALALLTTITPTKADDIGVAVIDTLMDDEILLMVETKLTEKLAAKGITL